MQKTAKNPVQQRLLRIIDQFPRVSVAVLADLVADEFVFGEIARVSREAPVLILKHRERTVVPGGGANAIYNLADLGVNVLPVGVVGDDEAGKLLLKAFRQKRIPISGILKLKGRSTVTKTRILAGQTHSSRQQVVRVDREPEGSLDAHTVRDLILAANGYAKAADALLVSDYGYGAATPQILNAVRAKSNHTARPVPLNPPYPSRKSPGTTAATPNEPEVEEPFPSKMGTNNDRLYKAGRALLQKMRLESLIIT